MESSGARWNRRVLEGAIMGFAFFCPWSIAGAQTCLVLGLMAWAVRAVILRDRSLVRSPLDLPIAVFLIIELLSALLGPDLLTGLRALKEEWIVLLFFLVVNNVKHPRLARRALEILVSVTAIISLYAIWQHFAGWDVYRHRPLRPTGGVFEATGLFGHHLTFGGFVMVVLLVSGCLFLGAHRGRKRTAYGLASLVISLALIWSYARSAWLGLVGGVVAIGVLRGRKALSLGLAGAVAVVALVLVLQPSVKNQLQEAVDLLQDPMTRSHRVQMWSASLKMIRDRPLLGVGLGRVKDSMRIYGCQLDYAHHPHNDLINVAANAGLLGLAAFLWIWISFLTMAARCQSSRSGGDFVTALATAGFGLMVAFLVAGLFQCYYTDAENGMILWYLLGMVTAVCRQQADGKATSAPTCEF